MIVLDASTKKLQLVLAGAKTSVDCAFVATFVDVAATTYVPGASDGVTNGVTAVDCIAAPSSGQRQAKLLTVYNCDTGAVTLSVLYNNNGTTRILWRGALSVGDELVYTDGEGFRVIDSAGSVKTSAPNQSGRQIRAAQVLTAGTSYTTPAGCASVYVECIGGGGGGGGATFATPNMGFGGGGASGAYCSKTFAVNPVTAYTYAIGGGGAAGANTGGTGGTGGDTTFAVGAVTITAKGGLGGVGQTGAATLAVVPGGAGVVATNGDINDGGDPGKNGVRLSGILGGSGQGGSSIYGGGGAGRITNGAGLAGLGYGAGGGGAAAVSASATGAAGNAGCIVIWEFY